MQLSPIYGTEPILQIEGLGDPSVPLRRQRERLAATLRGLSDEQWGAPSRCELWSVKDVVSHLTGVDQFWALAFGAALRGEPTTFLATFDPVATPELLVDRTRVQPASEVLAQYEANVAKLFDTLADVADWSVPAEAPPGHLALNVATLHALWDAWIHERDIALPLGLTPDEERDEIELALQYAAALSPAFSVTQGRAQRGSLTIAASDPDVAVTVDVDERVVVRSGLSDGPRLAGRAVDLIEGLSHRGPLPSLADDDRWLVAGLAEVFDVA